MLLSASKSIRVAEVLSTSQIVLNVGKNEGVQNGYEFIVYGLSDKEIIDPETNKSLGYLELYRGVGRVIYVHDTMCILQAFDYSARTQLQLSATGKCDVAFNNPQTGDYAKPNATKVRSSKKN